MEKNIKNNDRDLNETIRLIEEQKQIKKDARKERPKKFWIFLGLGIGLLLISIGLLIFGIKFSYDKTLTTGQSFLCFMWIIFFVGSIVMFGLTGAVATNRLR